MLAIEYQTSTIDRAINEDKALRQHILKLPYELQEQIWRERHKKLMRTITSDVIEDKIIELWGFDKLYSLTSPITQLNNGQISVLIFARTFNMLSGVAGLRYSS